MSHTRPGREHPTHAYIRHCNPSIQSKGNSCPISNLPIELLSRIFQFGTEDNSCRDAQDPATIHASSGSNQLEAEKTVDNAEDTSLEGMDDNDIEQIPQFSNDARLPYPFQIIVSHVCQLWRSAAISTVSLWTGITVTPTSQLPYHHVAAFLERSKSLPLNIRICGSKGCEFESNPFMADLELLFSQLVAHVHRWRSIEVSEVSHQQMYTFLNAVSHPIVTTAPELRSLVLSANKSTRNDEAFWSLIVARNVTIFGGSAPCLENIYLERVLIDWNQNWISFASRLTTLELYGHPDDACPSWDEFTTILGGAPALERLVLHGSGPFRDPPYIDPNVDIVTWCANPLIQLLKLTHLSLLRQPRAMVYAIIRMFYMPVLKDLNINFLWDDYTEFLAHITAPATVPATVHARPQSLLCHLEVFRIECLLCYDAEVFEILYDELENTRSLTISMNESWYTLLGCALILPLFPHASPVHPGPSLRLPRLETLSLSNVSNGMHLSVIRDVVQQRSDAGFPIKSLDVTGSRNMGREDRTWFGENVEKFVFSRQKR